jgi:hypothetical protein
VGSLALFLGAGLWWNHLNSAPIDEIPNPKLPEPNAFDYYVKAGNTHAALLAATAGATSVDPVTDGRSRPAWTSRQLAQAYPIAAKIAWLRKCAPALRTLRQGFQYQYREPPQRGFMLLPYYAQFRSLARLLIIESHVGSEQGDWVGASRSTLDILRLGHDVPRGGPMMSALPGYAINAMARKELQTILPRLDAPAARAAAARIEQLVARQTTLAQSLQEDRWVTQSQLQQAMRQRNWRSQYLGLAKTQLTGVQQAKIFFYSKRRVMRDYVRYMDALIAEAKKPYQARRKLAMPDNVLIHPLVLPADSTYWSTARDQTGNATLMVLLALRAFRLEHGRLPNTLSELVPSYLQQVPTDPFGNGGKLRYRRTGKSYVLYSVGPDRIDNLGKPIARPGFSAKSKKRYAVQPDSTGDYVAGITW